jgi:hypothetical protein
MTVGEDEDERQRQRQIEQQIYGMNMQDKSSELRAKTSTR